MAEGEAVDQIVPREFLVFRHQDIELLFVLIFAEVLRLVLEEPRGLWRLSALDRQDALFDLFATGNVDLKLLWLIHWVFVFDRLTVAVVLILNLLQQNVDQLLIGKQVLSSRYCLARYC